MIDFCIINLANSDEVETYYMIFVSISPSLSSYLNGVQHYLFNVNMLALLFRSEVVAIFPSEDGYHMVH